MCNVHRGPKWTSKWLLSVHEWIVSAFILLGLHWTRCDWLHAKILCKEEKEEKEPREFLFRLHFCLVALSSVEGQLNRRRLSCRRAMPMCLNVYQCLRKCTAVHCLLSTNRFGRLAKWKIRVASTLGLFHLRIGSTRLVQPNRFSWQNAKSGFAVPGSTIGSNPVEIVGTDSIDSGPALKKYLLKTSVVRFHKDISIRFLETYTYNGSIYALEWQCVEKENGSNKNLARKTNVECWIEIRGYVATDIMLFGMCSTSLETGRPNTHYSPVGSLDSI